LIARPGPPTPGRGRVQTEIGAPAAHLGTPPWRAGRRWRGAGDGLCVGGQRLDARDGRPSRPSNSGVRCRPRGGPGRRRRPRVSAQKANRPWPEPEAV